jgi:hypothetical protein
MLRDHSQIIQSFKDGATMPDIAASHGVTRQRIQQILKAHNLNRVDGGAYLKKMAMRTAKLEERNARYIDKLGCTYGQYRAIPVPARLAYRYQQRNARARNIGWSFTVYTWWCIWQESGKWDERGRGFGYCMARKNDVGIYSPENVYICTGSQNMRDYYATDLYKERKKRYTAP